MPNCVLWNRKNGERSYKKWVIIHAWQKLFVVQHRFEGKRFLAPMITPLYTGYLI